MFIWSLALSVFASVAWPCAVHLEPPKFVSLYQGSRRAGNYFDRVQSLNAGDTVNFGRGFEFKIKKVLGQGNRTRIFETSGGQALRIPLYTTIRPDRPDVHYAVYLREGIPVVKLDLAHSWPERFVLAEKKNIRFTLREFFGEQGNELSGYRFNQVLEKLYVFAETTWRFTNIGDFQLAYDGRKWLIIDMGSDIEPTMLSNFDETRTVFSAVEGFDPYVPNEIEMKIEEIVTRKRRLMKINPQGSDQ